jgi:hypothetical protein
MFSSNNIHVFVKSHVTTVLYQYTVYHDLSPVTTPGELEGEALRVRENKEVGYGEVA